MFRAAAGAIAAAASSVADEKHIDSLKETIRVTAGDAVRVARECDTPQGEESAINEISLMFFEIISLEVRSQESLRERLRSAEAELDFASAQLRRRDAYVSSLREEMLREVQAANELVRQYATKYNDLVSDRSNAAVSVQHLTSGVGSSFKRSNLSSGKMTSGDSTSAATSEASTPRGPSPLSFPKLTDTKELERRLDAERDAALMDPEVKSAEQVMREQMERKIKEIQIRLQREHHVLLHRTAKRGDDTLKTETAKLEAKVRQLEQQLRRKEADAEIQLQKERDRWRLQLQRATETAKASVLNKLWTILSDLEKAKMEMYDVAGQSAVLIDSLQKRVIALERQLATEVNTEDSSRLRGSTHAASIWLSPGDTGSLEPDSGGRRDHSGAFLSPSAPQFPKSHRSRQVSLSGSRILNASQASDDLNTSTTHRAAKGAGRGAKRSPTGARRGSNSRSSMVGTSMATSRLGPIDEVAALKDSAETLRRNLTIALLARDEAIAERDALAEELEGCGDGEASQLLQRMKLLKRAEDDELEGPKGNHKEPFANEMDSLVKGVENDLKKAIAEFVQTRNQFLVSLQTKMYAQIRRTTSTTSPRPQPLGGDGGTKPAQRSQSMYIVADAALTSPRKAYRLDSGRLSSPVEDLGDAFRVIGMTPQPRPTSAGRIRSSPLTISSNRGTPLEPSPTHPQKPHEEDRRLEGIPEVASPHATKEVSFAL